MNGKVNAWETHNALSQFITHHIESEDVKLDKSEKIEQAFQIVKLIEDGKTTTEIIKELSIGRSIINDIRCRKSRKYLNFKKPEHKYPKYFKNCLVCSEEFKLKLYRFNSAKFCSFKCYWKSLTGKECLK